MNSDLHNHSVLKKPSSSSVTAGDVLNRPNRSRHKITTVAAAVQRAIFPVFFLTCRVFLCLSIYFIPLFTDAIHFNSFFFLVARKKADDCGNIMPSTMRLTASLISTKVRLRNGSRQKKKSLKRNQRERRNLSSLNVNSIETVNDGVAYETIQERPRFLLFSARVGPFLLSWHIDRVRNESI